MKIRKLKLSKELVVSLLVLIPYYDYYSLIGWLEIYFQEAYIRSIVTFMMLIVVFASLLMLLKHRKTSYKSNFIPIYIMTGVIILSTCFQSKWDSTSFSTLAWFIVPVIFADVIFHYCAMRKLNTKAIITNMIKIFAIQVLLTVVISIFRDGLFTNTSIRLDPRGGGGVIFGYTIAIFFALTINMNEYIKRNTYYAILIIFTIGAIATQSRGAMWPIAVLWVVNFIKRQFDIKELITIVIAIFLLLSIDWIEILNTYLPRFLIGSDSSRNNNLLNLMNIFSLNSPGLILWGYGIGKFFPYQAWLMRMMGTDHVFTNLITINGNAVLVQPHNTFFYILMEGGLICLILFMVEFIIIIKNFYKHNKLSLKSAIFFLMVILANNLDSIFFVEPGVAGVIWLVILLYLNIGVKNEFER